MTMEEFWRRLLEELSRGGLARQELAGAELEQVNALADREIQELGVDLRPLPGLRLHQQGPLSGRHAVGAAGGERRRDTLRPLSGGLYGGEAQRPAAEALRGVRYLRSDAEKALSGLELREMFGGITLENILDTMFGGK
jgi:hypothetical protein